jgi:hypothetical protein
MKRTCSFLLFSLLLLVARSQGTSGDADTRSLADRLWFGGNLGLSFGTITAVQLDPMVGYKVDAPGRLMLGVGGSYWHFRDNRFAPAWTFNGYGYRTFARYRFIEQAFAHVEFLHMNVDGARNELFGPVDQRFWVPHLLVGGGYIQQVGNRTGIFIQVLFDVWQDPNSVYWGQGPIFSVGGGLGF